MLCHMAKLTLSIGSEFKCNTVDLWSNHSPWPFCNMPKTYFFLVKHPWLWRLNFRCSEPDFVHNVMFKVYLLVDFMEGISLNKK